MLYTVYTKKGGKPNRKISETDPKTADYYMSEVPKDIYCRDLQKYFSLNCALKKFYTSWTSRTQKL